MPLFHFMNFCCKNLQFWGKCGEIGPVIHYHQEYKPTACQFGNVYTNMKYP
jgi:hypothetical protein